MSSTKAKPMPPLALLQEMFTLDREAGLLRRNRSHRGYVAGEAAGTPMPSGHLQTGIGNKRYLVHRLVYFMDTGIDPGDSLVDHINGIPDDNRPENLRLATRAENGRHRVRLDPKNTSGHRNVSKTREGHWQVSMTLNGKRMYKTCDTIEAAAAAAEEMRKRHYGEFCGLTGAAQ